MPERPKALLFDLGNVCLPFDHGKMFLQIGDLFGVPATEIQNTLAGGTLLGDIERGQVSDDELHAMLCDRFGKVVDAAALFEAASDIFTADPAMNELLSKVAATEIPLILVSNTSGPHIDFVRRKFDVLDHFDKLILSYEVKAAKPELAFYEAAFDAAGCQPSECFYTDDIADYIEAARRLGVDAELFTSAAQLGQQLRDRNVIE